MRNSVLCVEISFNIGELIKKGNLLWLSFLNIRFYVYETNKLGGIIYG